LYDGVTTEILRGIICCAIASGARSDVMCGRAFRVQADSSRGAVKSAQAGRTVRRVRQ